MILDIICSMNFIAPFCMGAGFATSALCLFMAYFLEPKKKFLPPSETIGYDERGRDK